MLRKLSLISIPVILAALLLTSATMSLFNAHAISLSPLTLDTDNGAVRIQITHEPQTIRLKEPVTFTLDFLDPSSNTSKPHVNFDFSVVDEQQNKIADKSAVHTHNGHDTQSVVFDNTGNFTLSINVKGTGINQPFDTSYSGTVSTNIVI